MKYIKNVILFGILAFSQLIYSQDFKEFYIEVAEESYVPKYDKVKNRFLINKELNDSKSINDILDELNISNCINIKEIYDNVNTTIVRINIHLGDEKRVLLLVTKLVNDFSHYKGFEELTTYETLLMPNDFETLDASTQISLDSNEQNDLIMIRAQEAWDIESGNENVLIGVSDTGFHVNHPDLQSEIVGGLGNYDTGVNPTAYYDPSVHGSGTLGRATAATDNGEGISSIGFDTKAVVNRGLSVYAMQELSLIGARVVNGSFGSPSTTNGNQNDQNRINNIVANGTVVVCAAGNGPYRGGTIGTNGIYTNESYASRYVYPASYGNVISVSTVGNKNDIGVDTDGDPQTYDNWKDVHLIKQPFPYTYHGTDIPISETNISFQHNDSIDIVVPTYYGTPAIKPREDVNDQYRNPGLGGTSWAAPVVVGTIGLMVSKNYCLDPKEIETILKLTAVKIDTIPENLPFYGRLGAGRLDAYEAVKMSKDMAEEFGTVEVKDRILYRPWFYKLTTAPYEIKMSNNSVSGTSKLKFKARNNIEILSGDYSPEDGGYINLNIDSSLVLNCDPPQPYIPPVDPEPIDPEPGNGQPTNEDVMLSPNPTNRHFIVELNYDDDEVSQVLIHNSLGVLVMDVTINEQEEIDVSSLSTGLYSVKIFTTQGYEFSKQLIKY
ncbi:S8 family peptidase [Dokdonia sp.]|uniref:S8 family peptidase n=1 Tax=Dokdonia sp. TaxID=2024995 RepID=UPI003267B1F4